MSRTPLTITIRTEAGLPLRVLAQPEDGRISASLFQRPTRADARIGVTCGPQIAFVAADLSRARVDLDADHADSIWFDRTAFDLPRAEALRAQAWLDAVMASQQVPA